MSKRRRHKSSIRHAAESPGIDNNFLLTTPENSILGNESTEFQRVPIAAFLQRAESAGRDEVADNINTFDMEHSNERNLGLNGVVQPGQQYITPLEGERYPVVGGLSPYGIQEDLAQGPTPPRGDLFYGSTASETNYLDLVNNNDIEDFMNSLNMLEQQSHIAFDPFKTSWPALASPNQLGSLCVNIDPNLGSIGDPALHSAPVKTTDTNDQEGNPNPTGQEGSRRQANHGGLDTSPLTQSQLKILQLPAQIREMILHLVLETHPVTPKGTPIGMDIPELSLGSMQDSLDLFASHFNTSYPMIHMATFNIESVDHVLLLSMILIGSTYKSKDAHQMSVCLYDALIPHVFGGLSNNASPELPRLQSLLLLDCYGMYRAGPSQRYNALLLHRVLLNVRGLLS